MEDPYGEFFISADQSIDWKSPEIISQSSSSQIEIKQYNWYSQTDDIVTDSGGDQNIVQSQNDVPLLSKHQQQQDDHRLHHHHHGLLLPFCGHPLWYKKFEVTLDLIPLFIQPVILEVLLIISSFRFYFIL